MLLPAVMVPSDFCTRLGLGARRCQQIGLSSVMSGYYRGRALGWHLRGGGHEPMSCRRNDEVVWCSVCVGETARFYGSAGHCQAIWITFKLHFSLRLCFFGGAIPNSLVNYANFTITNWRLFWSLQMKPPRILSGHSEKIEKSYNFSQKS